MQGFALQALLSFMPDNSVVEKLKERMQLIEHAKVSPVTTSLQQVCTANLIFMPLSLQLRRLWTD